MIKEIATDRHSSAAFMFACHFCSKGAALSSQGRAAAKTLAVQSEFLTGEKQFVSYVLALLSGAGKKHYDKVYS